MVEVLPIVASDFDDLYGTFLSSDDERIPREHWLRLFSGGGSGDQTEYGFKLVDGGKLAGMLGTYFSQRVINGSVERFCNLHSWTVAKSHRAYSLMLMRPILGWKDHTITDLTPTPDVCRIEMRMGFRVLDSTIRMLPAIPMSTQGATVAWGQEISIDTLEPELAKIVKDAECHGLKSATLQRAGEACTVVCSRVTKSWRPYCYVHFASDWDTFCAHSKSFRNLLCRDLSVGFVAIDARVARRHRLRPSWKIPWQTNQLFRSDRVSPDQVDSLYTEVSALALSTFPSIRSAATGRSKRIVEGLRSQLS